MVLKAVETIKPFASKKKFKNKKCELGKLLRVRRIQLGSQHHMVAHNH